MSRGLEGRRCETPRAGGRSRPRGSPPTPGRPEGARSGCRGGRPGTLPSSCPRARDRSSRRPPRDSRAARARRSAARGAAATARSPRRGVPPWRCRGRRPRRAPAPRSASAAREPEGGEERLSLDRAARPGPPVPRSSASTPGVAERVGALVRKRSRVSVLGRPLADGRWSFTSGSQSNGDARTYASLRVSNYATLAAARGDEGAETPVSGGRRPDSMASRRVGAPRGADSNGGHPARRRSLDLDGPWLVTGAPDRTRTVRAGSGSLPLGPLDRSNSSPPMSSLRPSARISSRLSVR